MTDLKKHLLGFAITALFISPSEPLPAGEGESQQASLQQEGPSLSEDETTAVLSSCIERSSPFYQIDQVDEKQLFKKKWHQKIIFKNGLSGADVYKVVDKNGKWYVFKDISHRCPEDKIREISAHKIASDYGYGPQLYAYSMTTGKIVMSLLESQKTKDHGEQMSALVDSLKRMHHGPNFSDSISIIDQIKKLYNKIPYYPQNVNKYEIAQLIDQLIYLKNYPKKPTHRDLNPNNIFFTDTGVKFIDFENAAQDDPFFDIASIIVFYQYDSNDEEKFLKLYFGHELSGEDRDHLIMMKKAVSLFYGLTLLSKVSSSQKKIELPVPKLGEILKEISSHKFSLEKEENTMVLALAFLLNRD